MRIVKNIIMLAGMGATVFLSLDEIHSVLLLDLSAVLIGSSYLIARVSSKTTTLSLPAWTIYRVDGKVRLRRTANYSKIEALEKELKLGKWAYEPTEDERMRRAILRKHYFPDGRNPYCEIEVQKKPPLHTKQRDDPWKKDRLGFSAIHPMDEPYPIMIPRKKCTCNYIGCIDCNPPTPTTKRHYSLHLK